MPRTSDKPRVFNIEAFYIALDVKRRAQRMRWDAVAEATGVSAAVDRPAPEGAGGGTVAGG